MSSLDFELLKICNFTKSWLKSQEFEQYDLHDPLCKYFTIKNTFVGDYSTFIYQNINPCTFALIHLPMFYSY